MAVAAILDIDGTLVDTNYQHTIAWYRAFRQSGVTLPLWRIHRHIGMGGDQLVAALTSDGFEASHGDEVRSAETILYRELMDEVRPLEGARELVEDLKRRGHAVVLVTHRLEEVTRAADAASVLRDGGHVATFTSWRPWRTKAREPSFFTKSASSTPRSCVFVVV